jgi:hypothetical protein
LENVRSIADDIARWLTRKAGVRDVGPPLLTPRSTARRGLPFPRPPFLPKIPHPSFEIQFMFKGETRLFRYIIEQFDDIEAIKDTLRVHTNGELMVRVPDEFGALMPNVIYYENRSVAGSALGHVAPRA